MMTVGTMIRMKKTAHRKMVRRKKRNETRVRAAARGRWVLCCTDVVAFGLGTGWSCEIWRILYELDYTLFCSIWFCSQRRLLHHWSSSWDFEGSPCCRILGSCLTFQHSLSLRWGSLILEFSKGVSCFRSCCSVFQILPILRMFDSLVGNNSGWKWLGRNEF